MAVKLFIGGLAFATSSDQLRETFAAVGAMASSQLDGRALRVELSDKQGPRAGGGR